MPQSNTKPEVFRTLQHLKNVDISNQGILKDIKLNYLGKVNVICGKNGSGKTTILKIIESQESFPNGFTLDDEKIEKLSKQWNDLANYTNIQLRHTHYSLLSITNNLGGILDSLKRIASEKNAFYIYDLNDFVQSILDNLVIDPVNLTEVLKADLLEIFINENVKSEFKKFSSQIIEKTYNSFIQSISPKRIYVNPKRISIDTKNFSIKQNVNGNGEFFIEKLFQLKSSLPNSNESRFYLEIFNIFKEVSGDYTFDVVINQTDQGTRLKLYFSQIHDENWIESEKSGLGLHDLLLIIYFALENQYNLILIEEPENHLHPDMQRRLLQFLKNRTSEAKQFIISTHSSIFLDSRYVDQIYFSEFENGKINLKNVTSKAQIMQNLGYSVNDNLVSDLIILVEGSGDKSFLEEFFIKMGLDTKYNIKIWILGGAEMINQDLSAIKQDYKILALVDLDPESSDNREEFEEHCSDLGIEFKKLERYSIESYFSIEALNKVFNTYNQNLSEVNGITTADLRSKQNEEPVWKSLTSSESRQKQIKKKLKKNIREIAHEMTLEEIEGTDLEEFFNTIRETLEAEQIPSPS